MIHSMDATHSRLLIVEDDPSTRKAMGQLLRHQGFNVDVAGTVYEAMNYLPSGYDYALVDVMLPDGNGGEIVEWLADNAPQTQVTVLTGCNDPSVLARLRSLGPIGLIQKPVEFPALLQRLQTASHSH
jgi:DNA-binding response OmpR family regulator